MSVSATQPKVFATLKRSHEFYLKKEEIKEKTIEEKINMITQQIKEKKWDSK